MANTRKRDPEKAAIVHKVARIHRVTPRYVYMVVDKPELNEAIFADYMEFHQTNRYMENRLKEEVKRLVPFN